MVPSKSILKLPKTTTLTYLIYWIVTGSIRELNQQAELSPAKVGYKQAQLSEQENASMRLNRWFVSRCVAVPQGDKKSIDFYEIEKQARYIRTRYHG